MHPIIQAEVDEFRKQFTNPNIHDSSTPLNPKYMNGGIGRMVGDLEQFLSAALLRAVEKVGKEMVGEREEWFGRELETETKFQIIGMNNMRSLALSKLDTIINFKE